MVFYINYKDKCNNRNGIMMATGIEDMPCYMFYFLYSFLSNQVLYTEYVRFISLISRFI